MSFKAEYKKLNEKGTEALQFWEDNKNVSYENHASFRVMHIINKFFKCNNMNAIAVNGTNPKNGNIALLIYSGPDGDFDFEGRVDWIDGAEHGHLINALELLGINCHE